MQTENGNFRIGLHTSSLRGNDAATCLPSFVNLRKQILAVGSHRPHFCFPVSYIWETAISAWGYILLRCAETTRQLVAVVRQFAQANSCRRLPSPALLLSCQLHMGNGNFRMGLRTSSLRGKKSATSFLYDKRFFRLNTI